MPGVSDSTSDRRREQCRRRHGMPRMLVEERGRRRHTWFTAAEIKATHAWRAQGLTHQAIAAKMRLPRPVVTRLLSMVVVDGPLSRGEVAGIVADTLPLP